MKLFEFLVSPLLGMKLDVAVAYIQLQDSIGKHSNEFSLKTPNTECFIFLFFLLLFPQEIPYRMRYMKSFVPECFA